MGDLGDYWRDIKNAPRHYKLSKKQKEKQRKWREESNKRMNSLLASPLCVEIGDHHKIGDWHFWFTGTVMNPKTKEYSSTEKLLELVNSTTN